MNAFPWINIRNSLEEWKHVFHQQADNKRRFESLGVTGLAQLLFRESLMTHCATVDVNRCTWYFHSHASKASGYLAPYICFLPRLLLSMVLLSMKFSLLLVANALPSRKLRRLTSSIFDPSFRRTPVFQLRCMDACSNLDASDGSEDLFILRSSSPPPCSLKLLAAPLDRYMDEETALSPNPYLDW